MAEESVNTTETVTSNIYNVPRPLVKVQPLAAGDIHISKSWALIFCYKWITLHVNYSELSARLVKWKLGLVIWRVKWENVNNFTSIRVKIFGAEWPYFNAGHRQKIKAIENHYINLFWTTLFLIWSKTVFDCFLDKTC